MEKIKPLLIGSVGLGNFAGEVAKFLVRAAEQPNPEIKFVAVTSSDPSAHPKDADLMRGKGVKIVKNLDELLNENIEAVWLPLGIDLHRPFTEKVLAAGKAVMCEKPIAGCVDDVDAMIAARDRSKLPAIIGFNQIYNPVTRKIKQLLLDGAIGKIKSVTLNAAGPRGDRYFARSTWCGKFKRNGAWVMDSVAMNAHAHEIHLGMFLAGKSLNEAAQPVEVEAELYRTNPIENFDTISMRCKLDTGATLLAIETHACEHFVHTLSVIEGDKGRVYMVRNLAVIETTKGTEVIKLDGDLQVHAAVAFARFVRGVNDPEHCVATFESSRAHVVALNGASEATEIHDTTDAKVRAVQAYMGTCRAINSIESLSCVAARRGCMLHESGMFEWTKPAGKLDLRGYKRFQGPKGNPDGVAPVAVSA